MNLATKGLKRISVLTKALPDHHKLKQLYKYFNKIGLLIGADKNAISEIFNNQ